MKTPTLSNIISDFDLRMLYKHTDYLVILTLTPVNNLLLKADVDTKTPTQ